MGYDATLQFNPNAICEQLSSIGRGLAISNERREKIARKQRQGKWIPVKCVETGQVYDSVSLAMQAVCRGVTEVLDKPNRTCGGYHWIRVKKGINDTH